ncbi:hypothetical protein [Serratia marcescens]|uniref:hypothetical protein n=1 Tax=Serratia marcescens TaxID=615 RepID=UPI002FD926DA
MALSETKIFLLVCEGPTDIEIIRAMAEKVKESIGRPIEIRELSPTQDKTTGTYPRQGWTAVKSWCETYSLNKNIVIPEELEEWRKKLLTKKMSFRWDTLIKMSGADGIILQIDTDIAEEMTHADFTTSGLTRKLFSHNAVNLWLNEIAKPLDFYYLMSTFSTETWLLASHQIVENTTVLGDLATVTDYESIPDSEARLIALGYAKHKKNGQVRLRKEPAIYKRYGEKIVSKIDVVRARCIEADDFYKFLET